MRGLGRRRDEPTALNMIGQDCECGLAWRRAGDRAGRGHRLDQRNHQKLFAGLFDRQGGIKYPQRRPAVPFACEHAGPADPDRLIPGLRIRFKFPVAHGTRAFWPAGFAAKPRRRFGQERLLFVQQ